jgi:hypothetical protein
MLGILSAAALDVEPMNQNQFESQVKEFANWMLTCLSKREGGFHHHWASRSPKTGYPTGFIWCCKSLQDAFDKYRWPAVINGIRVSRFDETAEQLQHTQNRLCKAIENRNGVDCRAQIQEILIWGGVERYSQIAKQLRRMPKEQLPEYLSRVREYFSPDLDTNQRFDHGGTELEIDSGTTKVYSLICKDFVIYDSRVGAALGLLVRTWSEKFDRQVPPALKFAWGDNGTEPKQEKRRNPNRTGSKKNLFPFIRDKGVNRIHQNIHANWLLQLILKYDNERPKEHRSSFSNLNQPIRALEAALFMIGYCVNERYLDNCNGSNDTSEVPVTPFFDEELALRRIRGLFANRESQIRIPKERNGNFGASLTEDGILVDNLGKCNFLPWAVFTATIQLLNKKDGRASKGNAMGGRLGDTCIPLDSVEGYVAQSVFGKCRGDSVFRRITAISGILRAAGICRSKGGGLEFDL